ncbi:hypothetical protein FHN55_00160 [Streptomyces sp. NP160]|uniref:hypothetical protein n=1 Tax=Streptomyces sp. NP160 TaxID=2586637 RepID=UPI001117B67F|nr:hypothetical protein [Streptomyces sp. NP160]TNM70475.1 hypothetical protein FHN55_00160 [Streptomyces sp. NP160]
MVVHRLPLWQRLLCTVVPALTFVPLVARGRQDGGWPLARTSLAALALLAVLVRSWQLRVVTGPGVVVVSWFRTHRLDWREAERFTAESGGVEVELVDGRSIGVAVFATTVGASSWLVERNESAAEQLQRARRRHRDGARPGRRARAAAGADEIAPQGVRDAGKIPSLSPVTTLTRTVRVPVVVDRAPLDDDDVHRARLLAERLLATVDDGGRRWHHTSAVAARAAEATPAVASSQAALLLAAAWLHDVGYAPQIAHVGFHPVDGAVHLLRAGWPLALAGLVAHHSGARFVAGARRLTPVMRAFNRPEHWYGPVADALSWADQTTSPTGELVTVEERVAEVLRRHGPGSAQAHCQRDRVPALLEAARATERRLAATSSLDLR